MEFKKITPQNHLLLRLISSFVVIKNGSPTCLQKSSNYANKFKLEVLQKRLLLTMKPQDRAQAQQNVAENATKMDRKNWVKITESKQLILHLAQQITATL